MFAVPPVYSLKLASLSLCRFGCARNQRDTSRELRDRNTLPHEATFDHPLKNSSPLGAQVLCELWISLCNRNRQGERLKVHAATHRLIDGAHTRPVIARNDQLEVRRELKRILPHETRRDAVPTCKGLQFAFSPPPPILSPSCDYQTCALEPRKRSQMHLVVGGR